MDDKYSLSNLRDIVIPEAPAILPLAPMLWWVLALVVLTVVILVLHWRRAYKRNAYRRAGLETLASAGTVHEVSVVLKRVALAAYPREQVASLYGEQWVAFLHQTCRRCDCSLLARARPEAAASGLIKQAVVWIRHHRPLPTGA
jgi:hypothetical protein